MIAAIEQNRIGRLRTYAVQGKQFAAQLGDGLGKHAVERARVVLVQKANENLEFFCLLPEVA
jgi:hypothetical protein